MMRHKEKKICTMLLPDVPLSRLTKIWKRKERKKEDRS